MFDTLNNKEVKMEAQNAGIDYGLGMANIDSDTGIRYGVISMHEVTQAWCDSSEANYNCADCEYANSEDGCEQECDASSFSYESDGYIAEQLGDDTDIFIMKSPFYTICSFCSPCTPGAGYIMEQNKNGVKAYCFGHDWFDDGKAPYKVFDVKTDKEALCK